MFRLSKDELRNPRLWTLILTGIAVLIAVVFAISALRGEYYPFDDSFISFRYADNLIRGRGLVYNPGEPVEGYSNFLWTLLIALGMAFGAEPLAFAGILGGASLLACLVLAALYVRVSSAAKLEGLLGLVALAWILLPQDFVPFARCGLETLFVAALVLAVGIVAHGGAEGDGLIQRGRRWGWLYSIAPCLLILTRLDAAIFIGASGLVTSAAELQRLNRESDLPQSLKKTLNLLIERYWLFGVVLVTWVAWRLYYYGDLLPNTYYAKAGNQWLWEAGVAYWEAFVRSYPHVLALAILATVATVLSPTLAGRRLAIWGCLSLALFAIYVAKVGGDFMHYRFAFEAYPLLAALAGMGVSALAERATPAAVVAGALLTFTARGVPIMEPLYGMQDLGFMRKMWYDGTRTGPRIRKVLPENVILSASNGGMAYYSDRTTIDELGLNDRQVARQRAKMHQRGHVKRATREYLISRGVNLQLTHPWDVPCTREHRDATKRQRSPSSPVVWLHIDKNDCVRMDYLVQIPELTQWFCNHPQYFVLEDLNCTASTQSKR